MHTSVPLSVVVITKNEAGRLPECLESVRFADEIVIVDDESRDETLSVAKRYTTRVFSRRMDIEGIHRNWAYAQARHDWILSLDADERVTPSLATEISTLLTGTPASDVYSIPRRNYIGTRWVRHGGWYPSPQVKLFRRSVFRWEETTVHPRALTTSDKPWGALRSDILHYSYRDLADFIGKLNRQTTLEAQKWVQDRRRMGAGKALWRTGDRFMRTLWLKGSHRDGWIGYFVAVGAGLYQFLSFAKYWHKTHPCESPLAAAGMPPAERMTDGNHRQKLSVVVLTRNAASTIERCLLSVQWADEWIVIDGGSTDGTIPLARKLGARILERPQTDDFGKERNAGTDAASGDWVLQLDADEVVTPEFRDALEGILRDSGACAAYKFRRMNYFLGRRMRFGGWEHDSLHLFQRGRARYQGRVHERLVVQGKIGTLGVGVQHYPFQSLEEFMDRQNRYTTLEARQLVETAGTIPLRTIWFQTTVKPLKLFWKILVKKQGFRNGMVGFLFAGLYAFVHLAKWGKVWEILDATNPPS